MTTVVFNPAYVTARADVASLVPRAARTILDIGCSDGSLGALIKSQLITSAGCWIAGVEQNPEMVLSARRRLDRVEQADLDAVSLTNIFGDCLKTFDCIILADILEHLKNPWQVLREAVSLLSPGGNVITSIPNIRHITNLISLGIMGRWQYRDRGLHDQTHLRFFTRGTILELLTSAHLKMLVERRHLRLVDTPHRVNKFARVLDIPGLRPFFTYQYLHLSTLADNA